MVGGIDAFYNNWQPKPPPRGSTSSSRLDTSVFGNTASNPLGDLRRRIDAYDKSTSDLFVESTLPWMTRNVASEVGHQFYNLPKDNALFQALPTTMAGWVQSKVSYDKIFNIKKANILKPQQVSWRVFLANKGVQQGIKDAIGHNFGEFHFTPIGPKDYVKHVLTQYNIGAVAEDIQKGRILPAMAKTFGIGTLIFDVTRNTRKHYLNAKSQEDGSVWSELKTIGKTAIGFTQETFKSLAAWELGTLGYLVGSSLFCIGIIPSMIAGVLFGGLLETGFKSLFNDSKHLKHRQFEKSSLLPNHGFEEQAFPLRSQASFDLLG